MPVIDTGTGTGTEVETRVGAVLFTDLVGFTEYNGAAGDATALELLDQQTAMLDDLLADRPDGRLVKELGDGLMVWFDSAPSGLGCAVAFLDAVDRARRAGEFALAVRLGMHHGGAVVRGDDLVGQTVNIAARVAALAGPGELLVSEDALVACGDDRPQAGFTPIGPAAVRGVHEPIWLHRLGG